MPLRLAFMGTPEFSVPTLTALHTAGHEIAAVYTQPPRPGGRRGLSALASPVHGAADRLGIEVRTPSSFRDIGEQRAFADLGVDAAVVVAYGLVLPRAILDAARLGAWNGHASLLPRWRGAAPIQRAIMAGDRETGVMAMKMEEGLDTGPVALVRRVLIGQDMTAGDLQQMLKEICAALMTETLARLEAGTLALEPQADAGISYARKIEKAETRIDWRLPAGELHNRLRGLSPSPGAWCEATVAGRAERLKLLRSTMAEGRGHPGEVLDDRLTVACGEGAMRILELQRAGGRAIGAEEFLRGAFLKKGSRLS